MLVKPGQKFNWNTKFEIMYNSQIDIFQPEQMIVEELKADDLPSSPAIAKPTVSRSTGLKHGDKIISIITSGDKTCKYEGFIEERMWGQFPERRSSLFVIIHDEVPHFPIELSNFESNYGTITLKN